jgi:branched-chain amino acid transport system substrate-binding protein
MLRTATAALLFIAFVLGGCGEREPLRIGFLGALSGRGADLGEAGRNGAQMAIDEVNLGGGIRGRQVELVVRDDGQNGEQIIAAVNELVAARVAAIIGPMTSAMAEVALPLANHAGVPLVSPTVTARKFFGVDDQLFLVMSSTREEAALSAQFHHGRGARRVAVAYDARNLAYTESWLAEFSRTFQEFGGEVVGIAFESAPDADLGRVAERALAVRADLVMLIASATDAARLAQKLRERNPQIPLAASQWATTQRLIELGGSAVEGMFLHNYFDGQSREPAFVRLRAAYVGRFRREPDFAAIASYDATRAVLGALDRREGGETLHDALLERGPFAGAEGDFSFNGSGDSSRAPRITTVRDGQFASVM